MRDIRIVVESAHRSEVVAVPPGLEGMAHRVASCPCDYLLRSLAKGVIDAEQRDGEFFTQVTIEVRRATPPYIR